MTEDELKAMEQRTERVFGHSIQDRDVLALCAEVRRLTTLAKERFFQIDMLGEQARADAAEIARLKSDVESVCDCNERIAKFLDHERREVKRLTAELARVREESGRGTWRPCGPSPYDGGASR